MPVRERESEVDQTEGSGRVWFPLVDGCLRSNGVWRLKCGRALRLSLSPARVNALFRVKKRQILFFILFAAFKRKEAVGLWFCNLRLKRRCVT